MSTTASECNSAGRVSRCQRDCRRFESGHSLHFFAVIAGLMIQTGFFIARERKENNRYPMPLVQFAIDFSPEAEYIMSTTTSECNSAGRVSRCQRDCRRFESGHSLHFFCSNCRFDDPNRLFCCRFRGGKGKQCADGVKMTQKKEPDDLNSLPALFKSARTRARRSQIAFPALYQS